MRSLTATLLFVIIIIFASCKSQEKPAVTKEKVTIGAASLILSLPVLIAHEKGFFSEEGLDVTMKPYPFGKKAMEAMFSGEVDISTVAETPIVFNSFVRDDFVVFATFVYSNDDSKMLGRKDKGINAPADLRGKKLGITEKTSSHFFAHIYLVEHGINPSSVKMVDLPAPDLPEALQAGKVDAIAVFEPYGYRTIKALADRVVKMPKSILFQETFNLLAMKNFAKDRPATLIKILKAVDRAETFIKQNRKASIAFLVQKLKLDEDYLDAVIQDFVFELFLDNSLLLMLENEAQWVIKKRFTEKTKVPIYLDYLYLDAIKAVKPETGVINRQ